MSTKKLTLSVVREQVQDSPSSIFTREDVLNLLNKIEEEQENFKEKLMGNFRSQLISTGQSNLYGEPSFTIEQGNKIEIDDLDIDVDFITDLIGTAWDEETK